MAAGSVVIDFLARTGSFETDTKRAERSMRRFGKAANDSQRDVDNLSKTLQTVALAVAAFAAAGAAAIVATVNRQREAIDAQSKLAQQLRTSYESLSNLTRAGELAGVSITQITVASRQLDVALGRAAEGSKAQSDALDKLGLSAREVAALPLDERIATINQALRDNVDATERSAVAAALFGTRNAALIQQLSPETIAEAARQVAIFGLNLSDVDAAKVEQANDALSTFSLLGKGIAQRLTVEVAPALEAVGNEFLTAAANAGGLGTAFDGVARRILVAVEPILNAANLVTRVWDGFFHVLDIDIAQAVRNFALLGKAAVTALNAITPFDFSSQIEELDAVASRAGKVRDEALEAIKRDVNTPLVGTRLVEEYDKAVKAAEAAAAAGVKAREALNAPAPVAAGAATVAGLPAPRSAGPDLAKQREGLIQALQHERDTLGQTQDAIKLYDLAALGASDAEIQLARSILDEISALEKRNKLMTEGAQVTESLRTPQETRNARVGDLTQLHDAGAIDDTTLTRGLDAANKSLADFQQQQADARQSARDALNEGLLTEEEQIAQSYERRKQLILDATEVTETERADLINRLDEARRSQQQDSELQNTSFLLQANADLFDSLAGLARNYAGESSAAYRALFAISKAFAIADATLQFTNALVKALNSTTFPANLAAMAAVAATGANLIGQIASVSFGGGRALGGPVGPGQKYLVGERGPEMFVPNTAGSIVPNSAMTQQAPPVVNVRNINAFDPAVLDDYLGSDSGDRTVMNVIQRNAETVRQFVST